MRKDEKKKEKLSTLLHGLARAPEKNSPAIGQ
jgi:hypothetical protein